MSINFELCDHCYIPEPSLTLFIADHHYCCWLCDECLDEMLMTEEEMRLKYYLKSLNEMEEK